MYILLTALAVLAPLSARGESQLALTCDSKGALTGLASSIDTAQVPESFDKISINHPQKTYFSNRSSNAYDRATVEEALAMAVRTGLDPYYALATLIVETPPVNSEMQATIYRYGIPPLDAIAVADVMGCERKLDKETGIERAEFRGGSRKALTLFGAALNNGKTLMLILPFAYTGGAPEYEIYAPESGRTAETCGKACCSNLIVPNDFAIGQPLRNEWSLGRNDNRELYEEVKLRLGSAFVTQKLTRAARHDFVRNTADSTMKMALLFQGYNGYGTYGAGETALKNRCLEGMSMKRKPIYGAGVGDVMFNMVMANSEIREMIAQAKARLQDGPSPSIVCEQLGEGEHTLELNAFGKLQARFLNGRRHCPAINF